MSEYRTSVDLTDFELRLLDGACSGETQEKVEEAKIRWGIAEGNPDFTEAEAALVARILAEAKESGKLVLQGKGLRICSTCGDSETFHKFKSGPRKGMDNHKKPRPVPGVDLADRFVSINGYATVGSCKKCFEGVKQALISSLAGVRAQLPAELVAPGARRYRWNKNRRCSICDWSGHEGQMGRLPTIMSGGTYPGKCPSCGHEDRAFSSKIEIADGFTITEAEG